MEKMDFLRLYCKRVDLFHKKFLNYVKHRELTSILNLLLYRRRMSERIEVKRSTQKKTPAIVATLIFIFSFL